MLTFETSDEQKAVLKILDTDYKSYRVRLGTQEFELYLGSFAFVPKQSAKFIWYFSGKTIYPNVNLTWNSGEPNDTGGVEWCTSIKYMWQAKINDCQCNSMNNTRGTMVCQKIQSLNKKRGFKKRKEK